MDPNEDVRDLSQGDCDASNSDKYVSVLNRAYIGSNWTLLIIVKSLNCNLSSHFEV